MTDIDVAARLTAMNDALTAKTGKPAIPPRLIQSGDGRAAVHFVTADMQHHDASAGSVAEALDLADRAIAAMRGAA